jgi:hypothetical protein
MHEYLFDQARGAHAGSMGYIPRREVINSGLYMLISMHADQVLPKGSVQQ